MLKKITYSQALNKKSKIFIDVRSPYEFNEATIPGSINIPVLNNEERKTIGKIYHQKDPLSARLKGVEFVSPKIPSMINRIKKLKKKFNYVIIFCSRGNLRSESLAQFSKLAGLPVYQLEGGYKSYRQFILDQLENYQLNTPLITIHGYTGVGKTELLFLLKESDIPIIDIENMANHRGSVFGSLGLNKPTNQKMFDSLLWEKLENIKNEDFAAVEAESKKIGMATLPDFFIKSMAKGPQILIKNSLEARINRIYHEYVDHLQKDKIQFLNKIIELLSSVKKHLIRETGKEGYNELVELVHKGKIREVIKILLTNYYDPLYNHSDKSINYELIINNDNIRSAAYRIKQYIKENY
ncbi:MAG: tRNA 2-selenouridine(34) synthase MnmH [Halanaerobiales bacterium]